MRWKCKTEIEKVNSYPTIADRLTIDIFKNYLKRKQSEKITNGNDWWWKGCLYWSHPSHRRKY